MTSTHRSILIRYRAIALAITAGLTLGACGDDEEAPGDTTDAGSSQDTGSTQDAGDADAEVGGGDDTSTADTGGTPDASADTGGTPDVSADTGGTPDAAVDTGTGAPEGTEWSIDVDIAALGQVCVDPAAGTATASDGECLLMLVQGANVDLIGSGNPFDEDGSLCFEAPLPGAPSPDYTSPASMSDTPPCDGGGFTWDSYVEGFEGLANRGIWIRDVTTGDVWKLYIEDNTGSRFIAHGAKAN